MTRGHHEATVGALEMLCSPLLGLVGAWIVGKVSTVGQKGGKK